MKFLRELLEGDVLDFAAAKQRRKNTDKWFKRTVTDAFPSDDVPEPLRRAAADLKASRAAVSDFDAAKQRKMNKQAGPKPPLPDFLNPDHEPPTASVDKLPLRTRDDVTTQVRKVLQELETTFNWVDNHTAIAYYNPADYIRAVNAFDQLFGSRNKVGRTTYQWDVDDVSVTFALETRRLVIEIV